MDVEPLRDADGNDVYLTSDFTPVNADGKSLSERLVLLYDNAATRSRSLIVTICTHLVGKRDDTKGGVWHVSRVVNTEAGLHFVYDLSASLSLCVCADRPAGGAEVPAVQLRHQLPRGRAERAGRAGRAGRRQEGVHRQGSRGAPAGAWSSPARR